MALFPGDLREPKSEAKQELDLLELILGNIAQKEIILVVFRLKVAMVHILYKLSVSLKYNHLKIILLYFMTTRVWCWPSESTSRNF